MVKLKQENLLVSKGQQQFDNYNMPLTEQAVPNTIAGRQRFESRNQFVGERIQTCQYRFFKILQTRRTEVPRIAQNGVSAQTIQQARDRILSTVDEYVHCLRAHHQGGEFPEYLIDSVNELKDKAYTQLAPQYILEETSLDLTRKIFEHNYKV